MLTKLAETGEEFNFPGLIALLILPDGISSLSTF